MSNVWLVELKFSNPDYSEVARAFSTEKKAKQYTKDYPLFMPGTAYEVYSMPVDED